jgi:hypothetical protein
MMMRRRRRRRDAGTSTKTAHLLFNLCHCTPVVDAGDATVLIHHHRPEVIQLELTTTHCQLRNTFLQPKSS